MRAIPYLIIGLLLFVIMHQYAAIKEGQELIADWQYVCLDHNKKAHDQFLHLFNVCRESQEKCIQWEPSR